MEWFVPKIMNSTQYWGFDKCKYQENKWNKYWKGINKMTFTCRKHGVLHRKMNGFKKITKGLSSPRLHDEHCNTNLTVSL